MMTTTTPPTSPEGALADAGATVVRMMPAPQLQPTPRFQVRAFNECRIDHAQRYLVKGILAPGDLGMIFGQPGCGKSLLGPLLCHALASGSPVFGRRTRKVRVLYVAAEAGADMELRMVALRRRLGEVDGLDLIAANLDLQSRDGGDLESLLGEIRRLRPEVIVVDTLAAAFPGLEENEARDMGRAVAVLRSLSEPSGTAVLAIHHAPKDGETPRGHSVLNGALDVTLLVKGEHADTRQVIAKKNRNGPDGLVFTFTVELEHLGTDDDGDAIMRPVAVEADPGAGRRAQSKRLSDAQQACLTDLMDLMADPDVPQVRQPFVDGLALSTVTRDQYRDRLKRRGFFILDEKGNLTGADRERFRAMLVSLKGKSVICQEGQLV